MTDLRSLSSGPRSAATAQVTLASDARTYFVLVGSAGTSLPPQFCTRLPDFRSTARVIPQHTSATALFNYIRTSHSTYCAFYHWQLHLPSICCIGLKQSAGVSSVIAVTPSFLKQMENQTFAKSYSYSD